MQIKTYEIRSTEKGGASRNLSQIIIYKEEEKTLVGEKFN